MASHTSRPKPTSLTALPPTNIVTSPQRSPLLSWYRPRTPIPLKLMCSQMARGLPQAPLVVPSPGMTPCSRPIQSRETREEAVQLKYLRMLSRGRLKRYRHLTVFTRWSTSTGSLSTIISHLKLWRSLHTRQYCKQRTQKNPSSLNKSLIRSQKSRSTILKFKGTSQAN
ncbi:hypothetical protein FGO68_gene7063 [Halteria grandinella]|uniref:Uncharacterized protein n=1 Tax=Halteria grandinella TaxID=5974 RepID=A0A8J8T8N3_HALGN|nr:hypothetical protein FGO68_gene7063 [Halteria grandinella]